MRVTSAVRDYVKKMILSKVADRLKAAEDAAEAAKAARSAKVDKAKALCEKLRAEAQEKFVKEAKKLGLTFISDSYNYYGDVNEKNGNRALEIRVGSDDFAETVSQDCAAAKNNPNVDREMFFKLINEPQRIRDAANAAADKLLFELELGKIAKKELDELLKEIEVKI